MVATVVNYVDRLYVTFKRRHDINYKDLMPSNEPKVINVAVNGLAINMEVGFMR